jgi:transcription initiation factor TFIID subunit 5
MSGMSGPPNGGGPARAMSVGNGPPSAGLPPHNAMPPQQGPPSSGSSGPQSQQNLNQIVSESLSPRLDSAPCRRSLPLLTF